MMSLSYSFLLQPTVLIVPILLGALLSVTHPRAGASLTFAAAAGLYLLATPLTSTFLLDAIEARVPDISRESPAEAIVVLGGDVRYGEAGVPDGLGPLSLERAERAARIYAERRLPVLVSGGRLGRSRVPLAHLLKDALEEDFKVPVRWSEERSKTTMENARFSAELLRAHGIRSAFVVTQPWHMPRALWAFQRVGIEAIPAPTRPRITGSRAFAISDLAPQAQGLLHSFYALHEWLGLLYYRYRYG